MSFEPLRRGLTSSALFIAAPLVFACNGNSENPPDGSGGGGAGGATSCEAIHDDYTAALDEATICSPSASVDECTERIIEGLACSCPRYVNPANDDAIARVAQAAADYARQGCGSGITCGPCEIAIGGQCSETGRCENVYGTPDRGCKVDGRVYADGEGGIPDPVSCNTCSCNDGELACTEIACPEPCLEGTAYGIDCAECGPTDACLLVEHACFPTCVDACEGGAFCAGGLCLTGLCG